MEWHILVIVFSLNFCKIATKTESNEKLFETTLTKQTVTSDIDDTPSPEWVKYQQERFRNSDKLLSKYQDIIKSSVQAKISAVSKGELSEMETYAKSEFPLEGKLEEIGAENDSSKHSEKASTDEENSLVEFPSIKGFIEFIKSLKQNWMNNSLFRIEDKIKMLHQLKDSLLEAIEQRFMALWEDDENDESHAHATETSDNKYGRQLQRSKRGILDESSINFPPDAALMSINFLTFAVFLIKLVLQVINIVKTKHYQFSTLNIDTGAIRKG